MTQEILHEGGSFAVVKVIFSLRRSPLLPAGHGAEAGLDGAALGRLVRVLVDDVGMLVLQSVIGDFLLTASRYSAYGEISAVERVNDEGLVAQVDDARDAVAGLQRGHRPRDELASAQVLHRAVVVAMLQILRRSIDQSSSSAPTGFFPPSSGFLFPLGKVSSHIPYDNVRHTFPQCGESPPPPSFLPSPPPTALLFNSLYLEPPSLAPSRRVKRR